MSVCANQQLGRTRGEPARLDAATVRLLAAHGPVRARMWRYRRTLRALTTSSSDLLVTIPDRSLALDDHLDDLGRLAQMPAAFATALRQLDGFVPDPPFDRAWLQTSDQEAFDAIVEAALANPSATPSELWADTPAAVTARAQLLDLLDGGLLGTTMGHLDDILALIERTPADVVDGMFHGLTDEHIQDLVAATEPHWLPWRGWDADERHQLWTALGSKIGLESWHRLAGFTDDLDPPPVTALDDAATGRPAQREFFEALVYGEVGRWLTWHGEGDDHLLAGNDVTQGRIGNCYLIAAMIGVADRDPDLLRRMIRTNPNGTYTVRFADGTEVTVSATVPVHPNDPSRPAFASRLLGPDDRDPTHGFELWPLLIEKAYAQRHGGWGDIVGGWPGVTIQELVGGTITRSGRRGGGGRPAPAARRGRDPHLRDAAGGRRRHRRGPAVPRQQLAHRPARLRPGSHRCAWPARPGQPVGSERRSRASDCGAGRAGGLANRGQPAAVNGGAVGHSSGSSRRLAPWTIRATATMCLALLALSCTNAADRPDVVTEDDMADDMAEHDTDTPEGAYDDPVPVHTVGGVGELGLGVAGVDDGRAHVQLFGPNETYAGRHVQGERVVLERWDIEFLDVHDGGVTFRVRDLDERPDGPSASTVRLPGGSRGYRGDATVAVVRGDDADGLRVRVSTQEDEGEDHAAIGDTVELLGYQVTLVDRDGDDVHIQVVGPDGRALPRPPDD